MKNMEQLALTDYVSFLDRKNSLYHEAKTHHELWNEIRKMKELSDLLTSTSIPHDQKCDRCDSLAEYVELPGYGDLDFNLPEFYCRKHRGDREGIQRYPLSFRSLKGFKGLYTKEAKRSLNRLLLRLIKHKEHTERITAEEAHKIFTQLSGQPEFSFSNGN